MILAIDAGNTDVVFGLHGSGQWMHTWRIDSHLSRNSGDYEFKLKQMMLEVELDIGNIQQIVLSSVVPELTDVLVALCQNVFDMIPLQVDSRLIEKLDLGNINPHELGSDLAANAVGAFAHFQQAVIIVDFGTALTFTSVNDQGKLLGVAITPGVKTAMKSLSANTAKLPEIPLEIPEHTIGSNTIEAMQAGIMKGYVGLVKHLVAETKKEMGGSPRVIATGGLSFIFKPLYDTFDLIEPNLTLNGLLEISSRF